MTEPRSALAGWGMLLDRSLPRLLALLALKLGLPIGELLARVTPRELVLLAEALAAEGDSPPSGKPQDEPGRLQAFLTE